MRARAPGKVVLSGAYSVLEGAPAIVAAVDRYVVADSEREAEIITPEVALAVERGLLGRPVWFDASALREAAPDGFSRKLGLGSSAAILVASLAACRSERGEAIDPSALFHDALAIHRAAQGGGSGLDIAACCFGGVFEYRIGGESPQIHPAAPLDVIVEAWACPESANTARMLERVRAFAAEDPTEYARIMRIAKEGALAGTAATNVSGAFLQASLKPQLFALAQLGLRAQIPIISAAVVELDRLAQEQGARFYPSGAGGGDIALYAGVAASSPPFCARAAALGLRRLDLAIGAPGVARL